MELEKIQSFDDQPPLDKLVCMKKPNKREQKRLDKEKQMMHLKFVEKLKPQQIAKKLRCSV